MKKKVEMAHTKHTLCLLVFGGFVRYEIPAIQYLRAIRDVSSLLLKLHFNVLYLNTIFVSKRGALTLCTVDNCLVELVTLPATTQTIVRSTDLTNAQTTTIKQRDESKHLAA